MILNLIEKIPLYMILDNKYMKFAISLMISLPLFYYSVQKFEYDIFLHMLSKVNYGYIFLSMLLLMFSVYLRAIRWKIIFFQNKISTNCLYRAQLIGYFANNILPFRLGEWFKSYSISKKSNKTISEVFGTVVLERVLDMLGVGMILIFLLFFDVKYLNIINDYFLYGVIFFLFIGVVGCILSFFKENFFLRNENRLTLIFKEIHTGFSCLNKNNIINILFVTTVIWTVYICNVYLIQKAFFLSITLSECMLVLLISTLALSIPGLPGSLGTFEASVFYSLSLFGIVDNFGFSFILHAVSYIPFTIIGFFYFIEDVEIFKGFNIIFKNEK